MFGRFYVSVVNIVCLIGKLAQLMEGCRVDLITDIRNQL
jgi:hypothetical protein